MWLVLLNLSVTYDELCDIYIYIYIYILNKYTYIKDQGLSFIKQDRIFLVNKIVSAVMTFTGVK